MEGKSATRGLSTPGPWTAKNVSGAGWQIHAHLPVGFKFDGTARGMADGHTEFMTWTVRDSFPVQIADERWVQFSTGSWEEMQKANARLIAAAPDLLAVLTRVLDAIDFERGAKGGGYEDEAEEILTQAREAVSKATSAPRSGLPSNPVEKQ